MLEKKQLGRKQGCAHTCPLSPPPSSRLSRCLKHNANQPGGRRATPRWSAAAHAGPCTYPFPTHTHTCTRASIHTRTIMGGGAPHQGGTLHHIGACGGGDPNMAPPPAIPPLMPWGSGWAPAPPAPAFGPPGGI
eukprot:1158379-Pelagomonas_calceolata.AAC.3